MNIRRVKNSLRLFLGSLGSRVPNLLHPVALECHLISQIFSKIAENVHFNEGVEGGKKTNKV